MWSGYEKSAAQGCLELGVGPAGQMNGASEDTLPAGMRLLRTACYIARLVAHHRVALTEEKGKGE